MTQSDKLFFESKGIKDFTDSYLMFCLEQGNDEQMKAVPGFSNDHSGNTYTQSINIAIAYLHELVSLKREEKINTILGSDSGC